MRLAWFSPWPPQSSGVAGRSAEVVPRLATGGDAIDVFVDERVVPAARRADDDPPHAGQVRVQSAHDFVWRHGRGQYDAIVYQVGNSRTHEFIWPYLFRWPGLVVLHETRLHHARGRALLLRGEASAYRDEFHWNHPDVSVDVAEAAVAGLSGDYFYEWPMIRAVVLSARVVAAHDRGSARALGAEFPSVAIEYIALGEGDAGFDADAAGRRFRHDHRLADDAVVFGVFGALTAEKRVPQVLRAFAAVRRWAPDARLLLAGAADPLVDVRQMIDAFGLADGSLVLDGLNDREFDRAIAACDVSLNLRWPTAGETSGPWVRAIACGRATVVTDSSLRPDLPTLDPRTWRRHAPAADLSPGEDERAIAVGVDILDEDHSLQLAMRRLAHDAALRQRLGVAARRYWAQEHTVDRMLDDYRRTIARAAVQPDPHIDLPAHLTRDGSTRARQILDTLGQPFEF